MARRPDMIEKAKARERRLPKANPKETAAYSAGLLADLRDIAEANGHELLAHLITIAQLEASWQAEL